MSLLLVGLLLPSLLLLGLLLVGLLLSSLLLLSLLLVGLLLSSLFLFGLLLVRLSLAVGWRVIRPSSLFRCNGSTVVQVSRFWSSRDRRLAVVHRSTELLIGAGSLDMLRLGSYRRDMPLAHSGLISGSWPRRRATITTVEAGAPRRRIVDYRCVVHIVDIGDVYIVNGPVIKEPSIVPAATLVALAEVPIAIVDSAVEADLRPPKALMEYISPTFPTPPARRPQVADRWSQHPGTRHPVIVVEVIVVSPIAGSPDVTVAGAQRLCINRQGRRSKRDRHCQLCMRNATHCQDKGCETQQIPEANCHDLSFASQLPLNVP